MFALLDRSMSFLLKLNEVGPQSDACQRSQLQARAPGYALEFAPRNVVSWLTWQVAKPGGSGKGAAKMPWKPSELVKMAVGSSIEAWGAAQRRNWST